MTLRKPRHSAYTDDDPALVRALRYATEPPSPLWRAWRENAASAFAKPTDAGCSRRADDPSVVRALHYATEPPPSLWNSWRENARLARMASSETIPPGDAYRPQDPPIITALRYATEPAPPPWNAWFARVAPADRVPPRDAYRPDDPPVVGALRYATERSPQWRVPVSGVLVHCFAIALLLSGAYEFPHEPAAKARRPHPPLFFPHRKPEPVPPKQLASRLPAAAKGPAHKVPDPVDTPQSNGKIDLNSIEYSVVDDEANQLPEVVRLQQGILALVERDDQAIARYTFEPPDWKMNDEVTDVSGKIRFSMSPPSRWALLRSLADRHSIDMAKYQVDALFDSAYADCIREAIRSGASMRKKDPGLVRSAVLKFTTSRSCGLDVVNLEFKSQ